MKRVAPSDSPKANALPEALEVWLDDALVGDIVHLGRIHRSGDSVRFEYSKAWLAHPLAFKLDPELALDGGSFHPKDSNFGVFLDSCPDRWGQTLMKRRELVQAKNEKRVRRVLTPWDFFLGVQDVTRMGALRFSPLQANVNLKTGPQPVFTGEECLANEALAAPALTQLSELQGVAFKLSGKSSDDLSLLEQWLKVLVAPGASLGGARPKANVRDGQGRLWISKFPSSEDEHDWALREMLLHELAEDFGVQTSPARVERIGNGYHTFVTLRFDRQDGRRRFFTSAMALLGKSDSEGASYLDMADFLSKLGVEAHLDADLRQMFRRVLFNVAVANRDDHLRNHGFIWHKEGWRPAPAFDMNPSTKKEEHILAIDDADPSPDLDLVMSTADWYRVSAADAQADLTRLRTTLGSWERRARKLGLSAEDRQELTGVIQA